MGTELSPACSHLLQLEPGFGDVREQGCTTATGPVPSVCPWRCPGLLGRRSVLYGAVFHAAPLESESLHSVAWRELRSPRDLCRRRYSCQGCEEAAPRSLGDSTCRGQWRGRQSRDLRPSSSAYSNVRTFVPTSAGGTWLSYRVVPGRSSRSVMPAGDGQLLLIAGISFCPRSKVLKVEDPIHRSAAPALLGPTTPEQRRSKACRPRGSISGGVRRFMRSSGSPQPTIGRSISWPCHGQSGI